MGSKVFLAMIAVVTFNFNAKLAFAGGAIFGKDTRVEMTSSLYPWSAIGRVDRLTEGDPNPHICTGTLVSSRIVLTNAHCVLNSEHKVVQVDFLFGLQKNRAKQIITSTYVYAGTTDTENFPLADWAVVVLEKQPSESSHLEYAPSQAFQLPLSVSTASYATDFMGGQSAGASDCHIFDLLSRGIYRGMVIHDCPLDGGASGSPLFTCKSKQDCAVSAISARGQLGKKFPVFDPTVANYAVPSGVFAAKIDELKKLYP